MKLLLDTGEFVSEYLSLDHNSIMPAIKQQQDKAMIHTINHMDPALYDAVIKDNVDVLKQMEALLVVGDQLTATNSTVLHLACQYGSIKCVTHILSTNLSLLPKTNSRGESALHMAARQGHYQVVVALIDAAKSSLPLIQTLIRTANVERETPLHEAVRYNYNNVVQLLVTEDPSNLYGPNKHDETPLYLACTRCYTDIITTLVSNCESLTFGGPDGRTALHAAVLGEGGQCGPREFLQISECVKLILDKNKDLIKVQDNYGWTVFHYVAYNDLYTTIEVLAGADKSVAYLSDYCNNRTALHVAAYKGNVRVMEKLVEYFPDCWEMIDKNHQNILHIAVENDRKEVIRYILAQGREAYSNLLIQGDMEGNTPLHLIAKLGCYVQELMEERSLDWEVLNNENLKPLDLMHFREKSNTPTDEAMVKKTLISANVKKHWQLLHMLKEADIEKANIVKLQDEKNLIEVQEYKKLISTHMVVAALIATVALTAGFTMPGGFDGNPGPNQGSAILLRKRSFQAFIITDTLALLSSVYSLVLYFMTTLFLDVGVVRYLFFLSVLLNISSLTTLLVAFIAGTYAVLDHLPGLAISITVIASLYLTGIYIVFLGIYSTILALFFQKRSEIKEDAREVKRREEERKSK